MFNVEIRSAVVALAAIFAFVYGLVHVLKVKKGYFYTFSVLGFFSFALGRTFMFFLYVINPEYSDYFSLGTLGVVSGYMCIAFACKSIERTDIIEIQGFNKYKLISLIIPVIYLLNIVIMIANGYSLEQLTISLLFGFSAMPCSYYCLRNIITPYPKDSLMYCMRPFFVSVFVFTLCTMFSELSWIIYDNEAMIYRIYVVLAIVAVACYVLMSVFLERGSRKWMQM